MRRQVFDACSSSLLRLEGFDLPSLTGLSAARIREVAELGMLDRAKSVAQVGRPRVGKMRLTTGITLRVCHAIKEWVSHVYTCPYPRRRIIESFWLQ